MIEFNGGVVVLDGGMSNALEDLGHDLPRPVDRPRARATRRGVAAVHGAYFRAGARSRRPPATRPASPAFAAGLRPLEAERWSRAASRSPARCGTSSPRTGRALGRGVGGAVRRRARRRLGVPRPLRRLRRPAARLPRARARAARRGRAGPAGGRDDPRPRRGRGARRPARRPRPAGLVLVLRRRGDPRRPAAGRRRSPFAGSAVSSRSGSTAPAGRRARRGAARRRRDGEDGGRLPEPRRELGRRRPNLGRGDRSTPPSRGWVEAGAAVGGCCCIGPPTSRQCPAPSARVRGSSLSASGTSTTEHGVHLAVYERSVDCSGDHTAGGRTSAAAPRHWEADVVLRDGGTARICGPSGPTTPSGSSSSTTGSRRRVEVLPLLRPYPALSDRDVERFTHVDHVDRVAFVVTVGDEIIGVGRYDRIDELGEAEVAFLVEDAHQGRGVGPLCSSTSPRPPASAASSGSSPRCCPTTSR